MKTNLLALALLSALLAGCVQHQHGYVKPEEIHDVKHPDKANLSDFKIAAADVVRMMQEDEDFRASYNAVKAGKGERPVLMVGNIDLGSKTNDRMLPYLNNFRAQLRTALRKSALFTIVDDAASAESVSETVADSLVKNTDVGLKGTDALQMFGEHSNADYYLLGVYREFSDEGRYSYVLELMLKNLRTGEDDWNDIVYVEKE